MVDLTCALAQEALEAVGISDVDPRGRLADGRAMDSYRAMISAQGGHPDALLPRADHIEEVRATEAGPITWDALGVGRASWLTGAGRARPGEAVDPGAGVLLHRVEGDRVRAGEVVATVHASAPERLPAAIEELTAALGTGAGSGPAGAVAERLRGW